MMLPPSEARSGRRAIDLGPRFSQQNSVKVSEVERLKLARQVLLGLALICLSVFTAFSAMPENTALGQIFELIKIGALPLVTLVISFYFPAKSDH